MKKSKIFDLIQVSERQAAFDMIFSLYGKQIEISEVTRKRTLTQQNSLYRYCEEVAKKLNNLGQTYSEYNEIMKSNVELTFTKDLVKLKHWIPVQKLMFGTERFRDLERNQIAPIYDVLTKHYAERFGFFEEFPCWQTFLNNQDAKK